MGQEAADRSDDDELFFDRVAIGHGRDEEVAARFKRDRFGADDTSMLRRANVEDRHAHHHSGRRRDTHHLLSKSITEAGIDNDGDR